MHGTVILLALLAAGLSGPARAFEECGELYNAYGPFDYRTSANMLAIVEKVHFTPDIEALRRGNTAPLGAEIDYTLRASPNHHRALIAMTNLVRTTKTERPTGAQYTVSCYFDRAIRFAPDDGVVRLIYGTHLSRSGKRPEAIKQLELAQSLDENNPNVHYNLGLLHFERKDYPKARLHAQRAYALGFELPGLRKMLEGAGQWESPAAPRQTPPGVTRDTPATAPK